MLIYNQFSTNNDHSLNYELILSEPLYDLLELPDASED